MSNGPGGAQRGTGRYGTGALGIVLAIGATVATLGAAAPVAPLALAGALAVAAGAGLSVYSALEQYHDYSFTHAAGHSSLDPATALTQEDPSIAWLAVAVLGAVLDVASAATVVQNLAGLAKIGITAGDLGLLERAVRAQARMLATEGRLGDRTITMAELNRLVNGDSGSVHLQAWVVALDKVKQMRAAAAAKP